MPKNLIFFRSEKVILILIVSFIFLGALRLVRLIAWNSFADHSSTCTLDSIKVDSNDVSLEGHMTCGGKSTLVTEPKILLNLIQKKSPNQLFCEISKNDTVINCNTSR